MPRKITATAASMRKSREELERDLKVFLDSGQRITSVKAGETGQDEKNRSKHIVITRKVQPPRKKKPKL
ncbi:MAG: hypothetical protein OXO49_06885 [Gammaproteobacteria bacterium]|nr:hypothetical protein [Gammaproteobacteria bacterium]MDE0094206.1 hypothetical protein [Gammaproteobacteria bacterium]MDE0251756.1 hypothetical protein [Gammaproteobacteria bacterium]MDE0403235.1 hypothetical protein [Gammaproteobacteria bacterium]MDE0645010.1 hypothetical protein [Gammaproteobacteria bacterium]